MPLDTPKTTADLAPLFAPFRLGGLELANRIVMAPMTRVMSPAGIPGQANADYYARRAAGGVGLILSEGTVIDRPGSRNEADIPLFHGDAALAGWKTVIDAVHAEGGKMGPQIWHTGSTKGMFGWEPEGGVESPSGLIAPDQPRGATMTENDIADTIAAFAKAAADAKRLGFDVAEIHGAHGYLIDQFFWAGTNLRDDAWGGDTLPARSKFAIEIVKAVRAAVGPDFPVLMRLSQWKQQDFAVKLAEDPAALEAWVAPLSEAGVDIFHCSQRRFWEPEFPDVDGEEGLNFAGWTKKITGKPTITVGSVGLEGDFLSAFQGKGAGSSGLDRLLTRLDRDEFDLVAVGRALISNPRWAELVRTGQADALVDFDASHLQTLD